MMDTVQNTPFQKIPDACRTTGLSQYYLRRGCREGTVPHLRSGSTIYVNVPALLRQLGASPDGDQTGEQNQAAGRSGATGTIRPVDLRVLQRRAGE